MRKRAACGLVGALGMALVLTGCGGGGGTEAKPAEVRLSGSAKVKTVKIGLIYTSASAAGQGQDWADAATGAEVAAGRYARGKTKVEIIPLDDQGDPTVAVQAVENLVSQKVSGIVMATSGDHLADAIDAAAEAKVPAVLPYYRDAADLPSGVWATGVTDDDLGAAYTEALADADISKPMVVTAGGVSAPGVTAGASVDLDTAGGDSAVVSQFKTLRSEGTVNGVLIAAPASVQATLVPALQGVDKLVKIVLSPEALSPVLGADLATTGTLAGDLVTVGPDASDVTSAGAGSAADRIAAYFAALRLVADDPDAISEITQLPWRLTAPAADVASQDAVVVLVSAALAAGSADPAKVLAALPKLKLADGSGLAGPVLDLGSQQALKADDIVTLRSTTQNPGVRPKPPVNADGEEDTSVKGTRLFWFGTPAGSSTEG